MEFKAFVNGVKADVAKRELTLTFKVSLDEESLATAEELARFTGEGASAVELKIKPMQSSFLNVTLTK
jgi:hypothetical protein